MFVNLLNKFNKLQQIIQSSQQTQNKNINIMNKQEQIRKQNKKLREVVQGYLQQIERLKQVNQQHQTQIQTLLKFNERLLVIIETQLNNYNCRKSERSLSLQPISQITQKDSEALQVIGSIKHSLINQKNMRNLQLQIPEKTIATQKRPGGQTDRVILGQNLSDALSYELSRSDYQRQYSQYSKNQKVREVLALINTYKKQYGQSIRQCEVIKAKIKQDVQKDNIQIQNLNQKNQNFYDNKRVQVSNLKQKMKDNTLQVELHKIIQSKKYSTNTQQKLMRIMGSMN